MRDLPKVHATVVRIPDPADPESIAWAAANAAIDLLVQVGEKARGRVRLDRLAIVHVEGAPPMATGNTLLDAVSGARETRTTPRDDPGHAVMLTCQVIEHEPAKGTTDA